VEIGNDLKCRKEIIRKKVFFKTFFPSLFQLLKVCFFTLNVNLKVFKIKYLVKVIIFFKRLLKASSVRRQRILHICNSSNNPQKELSGNGRMHHQRLHHWQQQHQQQQQLLLLSLRCYRRHHVTSVSMTMSITSGTKRVTAAYVSCPTSTCLWWRTRGSTSRLWTRPSLCRRKTTFR